MGLLEEERTSLEVEDAQEREELSEGREDERVAQAQKDGLGKSERTSGTLEWRKVRGEATGRVEKAHPMGTSFRLLLPPER